MTISYHTIALNIFFYDGWSHNEVEPNEKDIQPSLEMPGKKIKEGLS